MSHQEICEIGEAPPIGYVPEQMYAQVIRAESFGDPRHAFYRGEVTAYGAGASGSSRMGTVLQFSPVRRPL